MYVNGMLLYRIAVIPAKGVLGVLMTKKKRYEIITARTNILLGSLELNLSNDPSMATKNKNVRKMAVIAPGIW